jgi:predicted permease
MTLTFWEQLAQDLRYGLRMMRAQPLFTALATLSLALGIGANTAIYSFMDAVLLRSLPVQHPGELIILNWHTKDFPSVSHSFNGSNYKDPKTGFTSGNFPYPAFETLRAMKNVCSTIFAFGGAGRPNVLVQGQAELANAELASGGFFSGLGVIPAAGRLITDDDDRFGATPVVAISFAYWQRRFGGNPGAVGQSILINNRPFTVTGVAAPEFFGVRPGTASEIFIPMRLAGLLQSTISDKPEEIFLDKNYYWVEMMGRLRPGVSLTQAQTALSGSFRQFVEPTATKPEERKDLPALILQEGGAGLDSLRRQFSKPLLVLMTMVGLILTIACANIANLLLARATSRRREMAVRLSLGAGRARVIRQLLTESVLLSVAGGVLGVAFAVWGIRFLTVLVGAGRQGFNLDSSLNWHALGFTLALSLLTGVLFGLAPAIRGSRVDLTPALKSNASSAFRGKPRRFPIRIGLGHVLVAGQVAICLLVLVAAGLFVRTLSTLQSIELGFNKENLLLFSVNARQTGYKDQALATFYNNLWERMRAIPGVRGVSLSHAALVSGSMTSRRATVPGAVIKPGQANSVNVLTVGPRFFSTMEIPILLGREIDERDGPGSQQVAVVNEKFAQKYFEGQNPIGRRFGFGKDGANIEIVGVSKNARYSTLKSDIEATAYTAYGQNTSNLGQMVFELRTAGDPLALAGAVRQIVQQSDSRVPVTNLRTQSGQIDLILNQERIFARLCSCFAVLALLISCVGLYGTMAYTVARRTNEIGIRMALGAQRRRILWMVVREVLVLAVAGLAIGLPIAYATSRFVESFLFKMKPNDPLAVSAAAGILLAAAMIAGYVPAERAARIDPMAALRQE